MIRPTIGVFTNIGEAHSEGFASVEEKEREKRKLFIRAREVPELEIVEIKRGLQHTKITAANPKQPGEKITIQIPFIDEASAANAITCWKVLYNLGYDRQEFRNG